MKTFSKSAIRAAIVLALISTAAPLFAQRAWIVASPAEIDARIHGQIERLAREEHATASFLHMTDANLRERRGTLIIGLEEPANKQAFEDQLVKAAPKVSDAPSVTQATADAGYVIKVSATYRVGARRITVTAATAAGLHNALLRLPQLLRSARASKPAEFFPLPKFWSVDKSGRNSTITVADFPSFAERGIVEGFYGKPWSQQDRLEMLRFEGEHAMNVYYYAPKDDPYHRKLWDKPYPPERLKQLGEVVKTARDNFVDFCFAISPGLSMTYSSDADFQKLTDKLDAVSRLGVSCFALFLDDVPQELQNPADLARYKTLAAAHVDVINRLDRYLKLKSPAYRLVVTPTVYTNAWGKREYIQELGAGVNPDVPIVWTGPEVVSPEITAAQAREWGALLRRKPLIWDNFPVNDYVPWRVALGPVRGRAPDLGGAVEGLVSNPMIQAQASRLPLETVADYLWNAEKYDPDTALKRALIEQYGPSAARQTKVLLETYGDYGWNENVFQPLFTERRSTFNIPLMRRRAAQLAREIRRLHAIPRYRALARELAPFPLEVQRRIPLVLKDRAFEQLSGGNLRWREDYDRLEARHWAQPPPLDGDFAKWRGGKVYTLDSRDQISSGRQLWQGAGQFSMRFALGWDAGHLYLGVDVTDPDLYQPFQGRDIARGDVVSMMLETAYLKNLLATRAGADEYSLLFSPGNFLGVPPDVYSQEDYLPPRPVPRDYPREVHTAWRRTAQGYSGDIELPASWFADGKFSEGYQIGLTVGAQKAFAPPPGASIEEALEYKAIDFHSKQDKVFPARFGNPATYQQLVLEGSSRPH